MQTVPEEQGATTFVLASCRQIIVALCPAAVHLHVRWIAKGQFTARNSHAGGHNLHWIHNAGPDELDECFNLTVVAFLGKVFLDQVDSGAGQY